MRMLDRATAPLSRPRSGRHGARAAILLAAFGLLDASGAPALSQGSSFAGRPGIAGAEEPPASLATCDTLKDALAGFRPPEARVDLWVSGALTLIRTDGVLWYLAVCSSPGIRVMCVTYAGNDMKLGDRVTLRGAYERQDEGHVLLDPCLASRS